MTSPQIKFVILILCILSAIYFRTSYEAFQFLQLLFITVILWSFRVPCAWVPHPCQSPSRCPWRTLVQGTKGLVLLATREPLQRTLNKIQHDTTTLGDSPVTCLSPSWRGVRRCCTLVVLVEGEASIAQQNLSAEALPSRVPTAVVLF